MLKGHSYTASRFRIPTARGSPDPASEDQRCFLGVSSAVSQEDSGLTVTTQDVIAMNAAMEDLRLEMQMERKETKKKHRRRTTLLALFTVIVGIVDVGIAAGRHCACDKGSEGIPK